jgi:hypothetical protein
MVFDDSNGGRLLSLKNEVIDAESMDFGVIFGTIIVENIL